VYLCGQVLVWESGRCDCKCFRLVISSQWNSTWKLNSFYRCFTWKCCLASIPKAVTLLADLLKSACSNMNAPLDYKQELGAVELSSTHARVLASNMSCGRRPQNHNMPLTCRSFGVHSFM
jgi:hypothetical protein